MSSVFTGGLIASICSPPQVLVPQPSVGITITVELWMFSCPSGLRWRVSTYSRFMKSRVAKMS